MKKFKGIKNYPLLLAIALSSLLLSGIGYFGKDTIYLDYSVEVLKTPRLAVVFQGMGEGNYPWNYEIKEANNDEDTKIEEKDNSFVAVASNNVDEINIKDMSINGNENNEDQVDRGKKDNNILGEKEESNSEAVKDNAKDQTTQGTDKDNGKDSKSNTSNNIKNSKSNDKDKSNTDDEKEDSSNKNSKNSLIKNSNAKDETKSYAKDETKSDSKKEDVDTKNKSNENESDKDDSKEENSSTTYSYNKVTQDYFDDALFIGDSRTVGLSEYSGWSKPTYYADVGMTIYDIFEKKIAKVGGHKVTVEEALKKKDFKKIYIMLGINELGTGTSKTFTEEYKKVIKRVKQLQPDAIIFIQGIMNVTKEKSDSDPIFNNVNIKDRNEHIAKLADSKTVFYIDVNEVITDESGGIPSKYTFDNIHLKAAYYKIWTKFLMKHGVVGKE